MSKFRFKNLEKHKTGGTQNNMELSIPLPKSASGKTYRECPNEKCNPRLFLMGDCPPSEREISSLARQIKTVVGAVVSEQ